MASEPEDIVTTAILTRLIEESAGPLAEIENVAGQFAQDSTGFSTVTYDRWFDQKHGKLCAKHSWIHAITEFGIDADFGASTAALALVKP